MSTPEAVAARLLDEANRIAAAAFVGGAGAAAGEPGLYAWFVDVEGATQLSEGAAQSILAGLVYAGQAGAGTSSATLASRIGRNHIGGTITRSTFRMTLASLLAGRLGLRDDGGRQLAGDGEARLTAWIRQHLSLAIVAAPDRARLAALEDAVLERLDPPLNLQGMAPTNLRRTISARRRRPLGGR